MTRTSTCIFNYHGHCASSMKNPVADIPPALYRCARCKRYSDKRVRDNKALRRAVQIERNRLAAYNLALIGEIAEMVQ